MLQLFTAATALPAANQATIAPAGSAHLRGLWTADETKATLRNVTSSFLLSGKRKTKQEVKGQCWMWSDPHVETLGGEAGDFMPSSDPIHTLAAKAGDFKIQSCAEHPRPPLPDPRPPRARPPSTTRRRRAGTTARWCRRPAGRTSTRATRARRWRTPARSPTRRARSSR